MSARKTRVTVVVPASTSNLGSGFDTLGLALKLYNTIEVRKVATEGTRIVSPLADEDRDIANAMVSEAAEKFFSATECKRFGIEVGIDGKVPVARGVGYSATVRLGVIAGLNALTGEPFDREELLQLGTELEGHPDNISPALFGGFTASGKVGNSVRCLQFPVSLRLQIVALFPPFKLSTQKAREVLPQTYSKEEAVKALNRSALITAAFASKDYEALRCLFDDVLHQPYREPLVPGLQAVIRAGEKAGALGGFLSGAGSGIICLTLTRQRAVAAAMGQVIPHSKVSILGVDNSGVKTRWRS